MPTARLPAAIQPKFCDDLIRFGGNNDGGYLVQEKSISGADGLITLGVSDDWRFEEAFSALRQQPVIAVDGTVSAQIFWDNFIRGFGRPDKPKIAKNNFKAWLGFKRFFKGNRVHLKKMIGYNDPPKYLSLANLFDHEMPARMSSPLLKIDIEGWEYRILEDILATDKKLTGLLVEFHDVDLHIDKIVNFIGSFNLDLLHVHVNNNAPISPLGIPMVVEMTFGKAANGDVLAHQFPHALDQPCNAKKPDPVLVFDLA